MSDAESGVDLDDCEEALEPSSELQFRQVHPNWLSGDVVSRDAFVGASPETEQVSVVREAKRTAAEAHAYHVDDLGLQSAGSWGVSTTEVDEADGRVVDDSACDGVDTPGHSYVDLRGRSKSEKKLTRTQLAARATSRGRLAP